MRIDLVLRTVAFMLLFFGQASPLTAAEPVVLNFNGRIDGSGTATVSRLAASWTNRYFDTPASLALNGLAWNPQTEPLLDASSAPLLPADLSGYRANVVTVSGRDSVAAEIVGNELLIHVSDTPLGDDLYEFQVVLSQQPPPPVAPTLELRVQGWFDGSDRITIDNSGASLAHLHWALPTQLALNGVAWDVSLQPHLANSGATTFLSAPVLFGSARFTKTAGRDLASYEIFDDRIELIFADAPNGDDFYDVTIAFAVVPEPSTLALGAWCVALAVYSRRSLSRKRAAQRSAATCRFGRGRK